MAKGLNDGDRVVVDGIQLAMPGSTVKPHEAKPASSGSAPAQQTSPSAQS